MITMKGNLPAADLVCSHIQPCSRNTAATEVSSAVVVSLSSNDWTWATLGASGMPTPAYNRSPALNTELRPPNPQLH